MKKEYFAVKTAFHGGGIISRHSTRELAEAACRRFKMTDCTCGCCGVILVKDYYNLPNSIDIQDPYSLAQ